MARSRNIKPGFFLNDDLPKTHPLTRLLAVGLPCIADRAGRFEYRPMRIKAQLLPYDEHDIERALFDLQDIGFILIYQVQDGTKNNRFVQIVNFEKHQSPHVNEAESVIPEPTVHGASIIQAPDHFDTNPPDSLNLIPLTFNPSIVQPPSRFDDFWKVYPKKVGKKKCKDAWKRRKFETKVVQDTCMKDGDVELSMADVIIADVERRVKSDRKWLEGFVPNPLTYINGDRWEDEIQSQKNGTGIPKTEPELLAWAKKRGHEPKVGESWHEFRQRITGEVR